MAEDLPAHRFKMREMFPFWGWDVREEDIRLTWHVEADLELAVWAVFRRLDGHMVREWVISEPTGILPLDHLSADRLPNASSALHAFAERWQIIANESLQAKIGPEKFAELQRTKPDLIEQSERMRMMIGIAAELLDDFADEV